MLYLLKIKSWFDYNTIDSLNLGERGGGAQNSLKLSISGDIDKEVIDT